MALDLESQTLDVDVVTDCSVESSETDLMPSNGFGTLPNMGISPRTPKPSIDNPQSFGVVSRGTSNKPTGTKPNPADFSNSNHTKKPEFYQAGCSTPKPNPPLVVEAAQNISDEMIEDGAHVVFDWDNTLKCYNRQTNQLSCRVPKAFLQHLKHDRGCKLYIISAIQPSALNLATLLSEVERLGLTDIFIKDLGGDAVDGPADQAVITSEYAHMGNVVICGYDKAETFLKLSGFDSSKGDRVMFFDDEVINIDNFRALVPSSRCYLCK